MAHRPPPQPAVTHYIFFQPPTSPSLASLPSSPINYLPTKKTQRTKSQANMAAAASPAISSSCFSTTATRQLCSKPVYFRPPTTMPAVSNITEQLSLTAMVNRRRLLKISAAVAQEEVGQEETAAAVEEGGEGNVVVEEVTSPVIVQNSKLYFGNLPYNCDSAQLAGIIQEYASPEMVEVLYDRDTGRSRGFAFVTMSSVQDCEAVIKNLNGSQYGGRTLRVNFSDKPKPKEPFYPESDYKLFVGNLSWSVTSESLTEVFQEYGNVVGARVLYDGDTGRSRGYGFVCYLSKQEMDAALESLNDAELEGRAMQISLALGKKS